MKVQIDLSHIKIPFHVDISVQLKNQGDIGYMVETMEKMNCTEIMPAVEQDEDINGNQITHVFVSSNLTIHLPITIKKDDLKATIDKVVVYPLLEFDGTYEVWAEVMPTVDPPDVTICRRR